MERVTKTITCDGCDEAINTKNRYIHVEVLQELGREKWCVRRNHYCSTTCLASKFFPVTDGRTSGCVPPYPMHGKVWMEVWNQMLKEEADATADNPGTG
jgi:hypothetical protein